MHTFLQCVLSAPSPDVLHFPKSLCTTFREQMRTLSPPNLCVLSGEKHITISREDMRKGENDI